MVICCHRKSSIPKHSECEFAEENEENEHDAGDIEEDEEENQVCPNDSVLPQWLEAIDAHELSVQALKQELATVHAYKTEHESLVEKLRVSSAKCDELCTELREQQLVHKASLEAEREKLQRDHLNKFHALQQEVLRLREAPFSATFPWQIQALLPWEQFPDAPSHVQRACCDESGSFYRFVAHNFAMHGNKFKIRSIVALHSAEWQRTFEGRLRSLEERRQGGGAFQGATFDDDPQKVIVKQRLIHSFLPRPPGVKLVNTLYVWHGADAEAINGISKTSFANLGTTDEGFFSRGLYASPEACYACKYATGEILDDERPSPWYVIFAVACMDAAYPVTRSDYDPGQQFSRLKGKEITRGYYAQVVVVDSTMNWQAAMDPGSTQLLPMEVVLKTEEQIMPLAIVEFEPH